MALAAVSPAGALGGLGAPALDLASGSVGCRPLALAGASLTCALPDYKLLLDSDSESDGELLAAAGALPQVPAQAVPPPLPKPIVFSNDEAQEGNAAQAFQDVRHVCLSLL